MNPVEWLRYRFEVYRFGVGPMYPLYREALRRIDEHQKLAPGEEPGPGVPLEQILEELGFTDEDLKGAPNTTRTRWP